MAAAETPHHPLQLTGCAPTHHLAASPRRTAHPGCQLPQAFARCPHSAGGHPAPIQNQLLGVGCPCPLVSPHHQQECHHHSMTCRHHRQPRWRLGRRQTHCRLLEASPLRHSGCLTQALDSTTVALSMLTQRHHSAWALRHRSHHQRIQASPQTPLRQPHRTPGSTRPRALAVRDRCHSHRHDPSRTSARWMILHQWMGRHRHFRLVDWLRQGQGCARRAFHWSPLHHPWPPSPQRCHHWSTPTKHPRCTGHQLNHAHQGRPNQPGASQHRHHHSRTPTTPHWDFLARTRFP